MPRLKAPIYKPIGYVVQNASGETLHVDWIDSETNMWQVATTLLKEHDTFKRVIFFDSQFTFVNALNRPGYMKYEDDTISEQDKQSLLDKKRGQSS